MQHSRTLVIGFILVVVAAVGGACSPAASPSPTPPASQIPVGEHVAATIAGVEQAMTSYKAGQNNKALEEINAAYLEHFEFVETPLEAVDATLMATIETKLREDLRTKITAGDPIDQVTALGTEILGLLAQAATKLQ